MRRQINAGAIHYIDMHLSHVAPMAQAGFLGRMDVAVIEVAGILADGRLVPTTSLGVAVPGDRMVKEGGREAQRPPGRLRYCSLRDYSVSVGMSVV